MKSPAPAAPKKTRRVRKTAALLLALSTALAVGATPSQEKPQEKIPKFTGIAESTLVEVPVHVVGRDGLPLRGLTKDDFELFDDGKRIDIQNLEVVDLEDFSKPLTAQREFPLPLAARRHFFFLFDLSFSAPVNLARARLAAHHFALNGMKNGDLGAVATYDVERGLKLVLSFTGDRDQLAFALDTLGLPSLTQPTADPLALTNFAIDGGNQGRGDGGANTQAIREQIEEIARASKKSFDSYQTTRVTQMIRSFGDLARTLNSVKGRKNILYFSEGFDSTLLVGEAAGDASRENSERVARGEIWRVDSENRFGNSEMKTQFDEMFKLFNRTDCVVHAVDVAGVRGTGPDIQSLTSGQTPGLARTGSRGRGEETLFLMAKETGGTVLKNSNDFAGQLELLQQQTSLVYLLVFSPRELKEPGRYHALKVKTKAPGARVSARAGYYEPRPFSKLSPTERRLATAQLLAYGLPRTEIVANVLATAFRQPGEEKATVPVIIEVPGDRLLVDQAGDRANIEIYAYATDTQLRVRDFVTQQFGLDLTKVRETVSSGGIKYYGTLALAPGSYWLRVLVRNMDTGRTGLQIVPVTVPEANSERIFVLPPLFHEAPGRWLMVKGNPRPNMKATDYPFFFEADTFIPSAAPVLTTGSKTPLCLLAYDPAGKSLEVEGRIKAANGEDRGLGKLSIVRASKPEKEGLRRLLCSFDTTGLAAGSYSLIATVRNPENGEEGQSAVAFGVR